MARIIGAPLKYIQGRDELSNLHAHASALGEKGAYVIASPTVEKKYAHLIRSSFEQTDFSVVLHRFSGECSQDEIDLIISDMAAYDADVVVGIGGGKVLDTAKAVGHYQKLPVIICPSIASTDAPCSKLSVIYTPDGQFQRYLNLPSNPSIVLVDTTLIAQAPARFLVAGMGDALATYFEARSCVASGATTSHGGTATNAAYAMSKRCYEILLEDGYKARLAAEENRLTQAVENIIEANTYLSGIGFECCGLAAAHAVHNGLTVLPETHSAYHGEKVAFGTLVHLALENAPMEDIDTVLAFCKEVGLPTTLAELGVIDVTQEKVRAVAQATCAPGETIHNMPLPVTVDDVISAIYVADKLGDEI
ncbi:MAG: glycerol dehydrogenase [Christensenellales bacterium]|jgi:glycerol dehydrogenase